jgi:hypothetical protein
MANWGIANTAPEIVKIKSEMADYLHGLNSCAEIDHSVYNQLFDFSLALLQKAYELGKKEAQQQVQECIKTEVKHSLSKTAWNVVGTQLGEKYKIARVPYIAIEGNEILTTRNKHEALEHALFISRCFNEKQ